MVEKWEEAVEKEMRDLSVDYIVGTYWLLYLLYCVQLNLLHMCSQ